MLFSSPQFIFGFLPAALAAFLIVGRYLGPRSATATLVAASLIFYVYWRVDDLILLCGSIFANFVFGAAIRDSIERHKRRSRILLIIGIVFNLGLIAVFKYSGLFAATINVMAGTRFPVPEFALPLGISFFTFTQITFLVDVYRGLTFERSPLRYALFVTFFPHLIAGPILHQGAMSPQFQRDHFGRPHLEDFSLGIFFFTVGLFKKIIFADSMGTFANPVFGAAAGGGALTFWEAWSGVLAYTMQIYFDFSGYSDMAIGLGLMFGVRLPVNFNSPYRAVNIVEFWKRWHMTLSAFLRDYLYVPLGGNRYGTIMRYRNLLITMLLGGLWHGANWTFVLWGAMHGVLICINHAWRRLNIRAFDFIPVAVRREAARLITFLAVVVCWVPFRAESLDSSLKLWRIMSGWDGIPVPAMLASLIGVSSSSMFGNGLLDTGNMWLFEIAGFTDSTVACIAGLAALYVICTVGPNTQTLARYDDSPEAKPLFPSNFVFRSPIAAGAAIALSFWLCIFAFTRPTQFLYFNF